MAKTETQTFHFRIPEKLHTKLTKEAKARPGNVSLNTYLLTLLETHPDRAKKS